MDSIVSLFKILIVCGTLVVCLFMVLLALPKSHFRSVVLELLGWAGTAGSAALVVSPFDLVPDFIPVLGQLDDVGYVVFGLLSLYVAISQRRSRGQLP